MAVQWCGSLPVQTYVGNIYWFWSRYITCHTLCYDKHCYWFIDLLLCQSMFGFRSGVEHETITQERRNSTVYLVWQPLCANRWEERVGTLPQPDGWGLQRSLPWAKQSLTSPPSFVKVWRPEHKVEPGEQETPTPSHSFTSWPFYTKTKQVALFWQVNLIQ